MSDPEDNNQRNGNALAMFWGNKGIRLKGPVVIVFFMWLTIVLATLYAGYRVEQAVGSGRAEHKEMTRSQDRTSCGLMMTPEERTRFRMEYRPGSWKAWCQWMSNED